MATSSHQSSGGPTIYKTLWQNHTTGDIWLWRMNGATPIAYEYVDTVADPAWELANASDVSGDGRTDLVWHNRTTGLTYLWTMNGHTIASAHVATVSDTAWDIVR